MLFQMNVKDVLAAFLTLMFVLPGELHGGSLPSMLMVQALYYEDELPCPHGTTLDFATYLLNVKQPESYGSISCWSPMKQGSIPTEIGRFSNLRELTLFQSSFTGTLPTELGLLSGLERLDVRENSITGRIPSELGMLKKMRHLHLANNKLTGSLPVEWKNLVNIEVVNLVNNTLTGVIFPSMIRAWTRASFFEYSDNPGLVSSRCASNVAECPLNSTCEETEEVRFGVYDYKCVCNSSFVNEANEETKDVPVGGTCVDTIPVGVSDITSTSFRVVAERPGLGSKAEFSLEKFVTSTRRESVSVYAKVVTEYIDNYASYEFENLDAGSKYQVRATVLNSTGDPQEDLTPNIATVITKCSCVDDGDPTGRPQNVTLQQINGNILFSFRDNSRCEDAFSFSRRQIDPTTLAAIGTENVFAPNYYYFGKKPCDEDIFPGLQAADKLAESGLKVGANFAYDVRAVSRTYSFGSRSSDNSTVYHQVLWEASIDGSVSLSEEAGLLPVENVLVEYQLRTNVGQTGELIPVCRDEAVDGWCPITTGEGGGFKISILSNHSALNNDDDFPVYLRFAKSTGTVSHTFLCNKGADDCTSPNHSVLFLKHLQLNKEVHVVDDTSVAFVGKVAIKDTEMPGAGVLGCPIPGAEVCLVDHTGRTNVKTQGACVKTDANGEYRLPAVLGTRVSPKVNYYDHHFEPASLEHSREFELGIKIEPGKVYEGYNLQDITKANVVIEVAGGLCNRILGTSTVHLSIPGCAWEGDNKILREEFSQVFSVPAHIVTAELKQVMKGDENRHAIVKKLNDHGKAVLTIDLTELEELDKTSNRTESIPAGVSTSELLDQNSTSTMALDAEEEQLENTQEMKRVRFQYDGQDALFVRVGGPLDTSCYPDDEADSYHFVQTSSVVGLKIKAIQEFGFDIAGCDRYPADTTLTIRNSLGIQGQDDNDWLESLSHLDNFDEIERSLRICNPFCQHTLVHDPDGSNAHFEMPLYAGRPNPVPDLTKSVSVTIDRSGVQHRAKVAILGDYELRDKLSVSVPTHKPLLVLRDPPGGNSFSYYENVRTTFRVNVKNFERYNGFDADAAFKFGGDQELSACLGGIGASACKKLLETDNEFDVLTSGGMDILTSIEDSQHAAEVSTTWSYQTSTDVWLAGKQSDTFLVPNLDIRFKEVVTVFKDKNTQCPQRREDLKFTLESPDNKPAIAFISRYQVERVELVSLESLLEQEEQKANDDSLSEAERSIANTTRDAFAQAISDWNTFLERHDNITAMAANQELENLKPASWFKELREEANATDEKIYKEEYAAWESEKAKIEASNENKPESEQDEIPPKPKRRSTNLDRLPKEHWSGLVPFELSKHAERIRDIGTATNTDGEDESAILERINRIKFDGGGSSFRFELLEDKYDEHKEKLGKVGENSHRHFQTGFETDFSFDSDASFGIHAAAKYHGDKDFSNLRTEKDEESTKNGFVLGDEDSGDYFNVEVFLDPDYGTFVFHTAGGLSRCPVEEGTTAREIPIISEVKGPTGPVMPDEPLLFEVKLTNLGASASSFQLFTDHRSNPGLISHLANGDTLTVPQQYDRILSEETVTATVLLTRGPLGYDFPAIPLLFRSACENVRNIGDGNLVALGEEGTASTSTLLFNVATNETGARIRFAEPCPSIEWAGDLATDKSFLVNIETQEEAPDWLRIGLRNLESSGRTLRENVEHPHGRLERVELRYRRVGSTAWTRALYEKQEPGSQQSKREMIDFATLHEDEFGFIFVEWTLGGIGDGEYELEARSVCTANPGSPSGFNEYTTERLVGVIDRNEPVLFGSPQPPAGELYPGEAVGFEFTEDVLCNGEDVFTIRVEVEGIDRSFNNAETANLLTTCQGRVISFQFDHSVRPDELAGRLMSIKLFDVQDLHGNIMSHPISHNLKFAGVAVDQVPLTFSLSIEEPLCSARSRVTRQEVEFSEAYMDEIRLDLSESLSIEANRISIDQVKCKARNFASATMTFFPAVVDDDDEGIRRLGDRTVNGRNPVDLYYMLRQSVVDAKNHSTFVDMSGMRWQRSERTFAPASSAGEAGHLGASSSPPNGQKEDQAQVIDLLVATIEEMKDASHDNSVVTVIGFFISTMVMVFFVLRSHRL